MEKCTLKLIMVHHNNYNRWVTPTKELDSLVHKRLKDDEGYLKIPAIF
jgi:hypothetical protein